MSLCLQVCQNCGAQQYPRRDICHNCLSTELHDDWVAPEGTLLSWTRGHFSVLPEFKDKTPLILARVKLREGAVVLALSNKEVSVGEDVSVDVQDALLTLT
ncbi:MAG: zinc ribbon domain-containing protein [Pseudomonadota bacterium]